MLQSPVSISQGKPPSDGKVGTQLIPKDAPGRGVGKIGLGCNRSKRRACSPIRAQAKGRVQANPRGQAVVERSSSIKLGKGNKLRLVLVASPIDRCFSIYSEAHTVNADMHCRGIKLRQSSRVIEDRRWAVGGCDKRIPS